MIYKEKKIANSLAIAFWTATAKDNETVTIPVDGSWDFITHYSVDKPVSSYLAAPMTKPLTLLISKGDNFVGIRFAVGVRLSNYNMSHFNDTLVSIDDITLPQHIKTMLYKLNPSNVDKVLTYLEARCLVEVNTKVLASGDMSVRTKQRVFRQYTGYTNNFLLQLDKANYAKRLIVNDVPLKEAAYEAGFADQAHMNRTIKLVYGITPTKLKQKRCRFYSIAA